MPSIDLTSNKNVILPKTNCIHAMMKANAVLEVGIYKNLLLCKYQRSDQAISLTVYPVLVHLL